MFSIETNTLTLLSPTSRENQFYFKLLQQNKKKITILELLAVTVTFSCM